MDECETKVMNNETKIRLSISNECCCQFLVVPIKWRYTRINQHFYHKTTNSYKKITQFFRNMYKKKMLDSVLLGCCLQKLHQYLASSRIQLNIFFPLFFSTQFFCVVKNSVYEMNIIINNYNNNNKHSSKRKDESEERQFGYGRLLLLWCL